MNQKQMAISPTYQQGSLPNGEKSLAWIKKALLSVLEGASTGHLILRENGIRIAEFGQPGDALQAEINVIDSRCYTKALIGGDAAAGEAFVDGWWTTPDITMVTRFFFAQSRHDGCVGGAFWLAFKAHFLVPTIKTVKY